MSKEGSAISGHLFGPGDPGAALARKQRRRDARVRNARRAEQNAGQDADTKREQDTGR
jgi:hypothetical protein